jgi:hypothetical protein
MDNTTNQYTYMYVGGIPSTYPKFDTDYVIFEAFDGQSDYGPLPSCTDVPGPVGTAKSLTYNFTAFDTGVPPNYTAYTGSDPWHATWFGNSTATDFPPTSPSCGWGTGGTEWSEIAKFKP